MIMTPGVLLDAQHVQHVTPDRHWLPVVDAGLIAVTPFGIVVVACEGGEPHHYPPIDGAWAVLPATSCLS